MPPRQNKAADAPATGPVDEGAVTKQENHQASDEQASDETQLPDEAPATDPVDEGAQDVVEAETEELPGTIRMVHPDGGRCDQYDPDEDGIHVVPVEEVANLLDHGFVAFVPKSEG